MRRKKFRQIGTYLCITALSFSMMVGCSPGAAFFPPPYIPADYYDCAPIEPIQLITEYFGDHAEQRWSEVNAKYNDVVFIFKNVPVEQHMLSELDGGFFRTQQIQCHLLNPGSMDQFEPGDSIDIVGRNAGPANQYIPELTFTECVVIPAGLLALPAVSEDTSSHFVPSY